MSRTRNESDDALKTWQLFDAEAAYADSIFQMALGDTERSVAAAERALALRPDYPPAVLTIGSIEYQRRRESEGRLLFLSLHRDHQPRGYGALDPWGSLSAYDHQQ